MNALPQREQYRLVADMAAAVIVAPAAPGSKMEALSRKVLADGKPLYTFDHPANVPVLQTGARPISTDFTQFKSECSRGDRRL